MSNKLFVGKAKPKKWVMPKWMNAYRGELQDVGLGIEDLMNDHDSTTFNNEYRALVCVSMKAQVALLERLYAKGLLCLLIAVVAAACGITPPTSPLAACPAIAANFVRTDTLWLTFPKPIGPDGKPYPRIIGNLVDVFACNGAIVSKARTP